MLFSICSLLFLQLLNLSIHGADARPDPLGNSMNPQVHATELAEQINGTNIPLDEKSIEAPIYDQDEVDKIKTSVKDVAENAHNPENLPIIGGFAKEHKDMMGLNSTVGPSAEDVTETPATPGTPSTFSTSETTWSTPSTPSTPSTSKMASESSASTTTALLTTIGSTASSIEITTTTELPSTTSSTTTTSTGTSTQSV